MTTPAIRHSSLRAEPPKVTLAHANKWLDKAGISRVTDITGLDILGIPVFAAIRPQALPDAVTYGKGMTAIDAQVGATMESIEFHFAQQHAEHEIETRWLSAADIQPIHNDKPGILDYCPVANVEIDLDAPLLLAKATDLTTGTTSFVPAELVFHPAKNVGQTIFGTSTNGLASGNTRLEAAYHSLCEIIERDIWSFQTIRDTSRFIAPQGLPAKVTELIDKAAEHGLEVIIRAVNNDYDLAFFSAWIYDKKNPTKAFFNSGWGCHPHRDIALSRAVCEAVQSRAAVIHGARSFGLDVNHLGGESVQGSVNFLTRDSKEPMLFSDVIDHQSQQDMQTQWQWLVGKLKQVSDVPVYCCNFTKADEPLQVLRLIVPTLENHKRINMRVGPRLQKYLAEL